MAKFDRKAQSQPKHKPTKPSSANKSNAPPPGWNQRPGWKGPSYIKKQPSRPQPSSSSGGPAPNLQPQLLPTEVQQLLLNVFRDTFPASRDFDALKPTLQQIKDALYERDFERAFGKEEFLEAYAIRWSPSRTLAYANLLAGILTSEAEDEVWARRFMRGGDVERPCKAVCFGGGAAEIMAFGALLKHLRAGATGKPVAAEGAAIEDGVSKLSVNDDERSASAILLDLQLVDSASWTSVVSKLSKSLMTAPELSKYASAVARAKNAPILAAEAIRTNFTQADILASNLDDLKSMIGPGPVLITLLFTLNELYNTSIPKTTKFMLEMTLAAPKDTLLLVVDSPGSYSETSIGKTEEGGEKKKYPMHWLMDYVLLDKGKKQAEGERMKESEPMWEKLVGDESRWFRLEEGLKYPASLENMKLQVHLFRRL